MPRMLRSLKSESFRTAPTVVMPSDASALSKRGGRSSILRRVLSGASRWEEYMDAAEDRRRMVPRDRPASAAFGPAVHGVWRTGRAKARQPYEKISPGSVHI